MKNGEVVTQQARVIVIPLKNSPLRHGWGLRYISGVPDIEPGKEDLYVGDWRPQIDNVSFTFSSNPWLWDTEDEVQFLAREFRAKFEIEVEPVSL
jgi:hypothetical protein